MPGEECLGVRSSEDVQGLHRQVGVPGVGSPHDLRSLASARAARHVQGHQRVSVNNSDCASRNEGECRLQIGALALDRLAEPEALGYAREDVEHGLAGGRAAGGGRNRGLHVPGWCSLHRPRDEGVAKPAERELGHEGTAAAVYLVAGRLVAVDISLRLVAAGPPDRHDRLLNPW